MYYFPVGVALSSESTVSGPTPQIVSDLAKHVRATLKSTYAIGESGTAGPTGGTARNRTPSVQFLAFITSF